MIVKIQVSHNLPFQVVLVEVVKYVNAYAFWFMTHKIRQNRLAWWSC